MNPNPNPYLLSGEQARPLERGFHQPLTEEQAALVERIEAHAGWRAVMVHYGAPLLVAHSALADVPTDMDGWEAKLDEITASAGYQASAEKRSDNR